MAKQDHTVAADRQPIDLLLRPFQQFAAKQTSGGILLLVASVIAFGWANSPWRDSYFHLWETKLTIGLDHFSLSESLEYWINDGLMAIFFFVVGLEIKRELLEGELASVKKAMLPLMAALGGMVVPAVIYTLFNYSRPGVHGWGIPMATDIAFALGILALLGDRVPVGLKIFVTAVAIVDDLGAVLVIALFYTAQIDWGSLGIAAVCFVLLIAVNLLGIRRIYLHVLIGIALWLAILNSGVHATIAGVLTALTIPVRRRVDPQKFLTASRSALDRLEKAAGSADPSEVKGAQEAALITLEEESKKARSPLLHLEHVLHPWVAFAIMPIFALANAGVTVENGIESLKHPISLGIILGLVLGKPIGILMFSFLGILIGIASFPPSVSRTHLFGAGILAGIGFTMSLFISNLAFAEPSLISMAKIGILAGSLIAGITGWIVLRKTATSR